MIGQTIKGAMSGNPAQEPLIVDSMKYVAKRISEVEDDHQLDLLLTLLEQDYNPALTPHILNLTGVIIQVLLE